MTAWKDTHYFINMAYKYKKVRLSDGSTRDQHRIIMETIIGRKLSRNEVVHHIDGDTMNNDLSNLELISLSDHTKSHMRNAEGFHRLYL